MLILAAAYLGHESVRINVLTRCPWLVQAVDGSCACTCFVVMAQTSLLAPVLSPEKNGLRLQGITYY